MPKGKGYSRGLAGTRAVESDMSKVPGAKGGAENPPVVGESGSKATPKGRHTGRNSSSSGAYGHDGVMGKRGGTRT